MGNKLNTLSAAHKPHKVSSTFDILHAQHVQTNNRQLWIDPHVMLQAVIQPTSLAVTQHEIMAQSATTLVLYMAYTQLGHMA